MKILFSSNVFDLYIRREALAVMYLSAALKKAGHETMAAPSNLPDLKKAMAQFKPDAVAFGTLTGTYRHYLSIAEKLKAETGVMTLFGGVHPTFNPEIIEQKAVDAICIGEGELAMTEFADKFDKGQDYWSTPNWIAKHDGQVHKTDVRPLIDDIDTIEFPDRGLFYDVSQEFADNPIKTFLAARGCPYDCSYCFNASFRKLYKGLGKPVRIRGVANLLDEVQQVKDRYPMQIVWYLADTFTLKKSWLREFSQEHRRRIGIPFYGNVRADLVDQEVVDYLKNGMCMSVAMGVEAGNPKLRNSILKRGLEDGQIINAAKLIRGAGIGLLTFNITALPGGTIEDDIRTIDLNINAGVDYPSVSFMIPFPKTEMYRTAEKLGLLPDHEINYDEGYYQSPILKVESPIKHVRLLYLFALAVQFKWIRALLPKLLELPLTPLYSLAYKLWKGYTSKYRIFPHKLKMSESFKSVWRYLTNLQR